MRVFDPREMFAPGGLVGRGHTLEGCLKLLVSLFSVYLSVDEKQKKH